MKKIYMSVMVAVTSLLVGCGGGNSDPGNTDDTPTKNTVTPIKIEQNTTLSWVASFGSTEKDTCYFSTVDKHGNSYMTGYFKGTIDFDGTGRYTATSHGAEDIFVVKLDKTGAVVWFKTMGGSDTDKGASILIDSADHIYVGGDFRSANVDFEGTGSNLSSSNGQEDIFLLKLDSDGNVLDIRTFGKGGKDAIISMTMDSDKNLLLTGLFGATIDFDSGGGGHLEAAGSFDAFILKLDSDGQFVWAKSFDGSDWVKGLFIVTDSHNNVYITGYFRGEADFDPGSGTHNLTAVGDRDFYIAKLNSQGEFVWAGGIGSTGEDRALSMAIDGADDLYLVGFFNGECDFDIGAGEHTLTSHGHGDAFVLKIQHDGTFAWVKQIGGIGGDKASEITFDSFGDILVSGYFKGRVDFDPGEGEAMSVSNGGSDIFLLKLDNTGSYLWHRTFGGTQNDQALTLSLDPANHLYLSGNFFGSVSFGDGTSTVSARGDSDIFLLKI